MTLPSKIIPASLFSQVTYETIVDFYYSKEGAAKLPAYCAALTGSLGVTCLIGVDICANATLYAGKRIYHYRNPDACAHKQKFYEEDAKAHGAAVWRAIKNLDKVFKLIFIPLVHRSAPVGKLTYEARLAREVYQKTRENLQQKLCSLMRRIDSKAAKEAAVKSHALFLGSKKNWSSLISKSKSKQRQELRKSCSHELRIAKFIQNRAAKKIQRHWRNKPDFSGPFGEWSRKHRKDFVAHAIFDKGSVEKIFRSGQVMPSEMLFRQQEKVEWEAGGARGERGTMQFPSMDEEMRKKMLALPSTRERLVIEDGGVWLNPEVNSNFWKEAQALKRALPADSPFKRFYDQSFSIMRDQLCDPADRIDAILTQLFNALLKEGKSKLEVDLKCHSLRALIVPWSSLKFANYCGRNCIYWSYGEVIVIRGNGRSITNTTWLEDERSKKSDQLCLLSPHENNGRFFCMDLAQQDTFILGPRKALESFRKQYSYRIIFIEELSSRQRRQLEVPRSLCPKEAASKKGAAAAVNVGL